MGCPQFMDTLELPHSENLAGTRAVEVLLPKPVRHASVSEAKGQMSPPRRDNLRSQFGRTG
jgi:hypothetical protein